MVLKRGGRWSYNCRFTGYFHQDFLNIARRILVQLPSSFFSIHLVSVHVVHLYCSIDTTAAWKKLHFILSYRSDFHITDNLSTAVHTFSSRVLMSFSVDETLLPKSQNLSISFRDLPFIWLKHINGFVGVNMEAYATCWSLPTMQQEFSQGGCIC